MTSYLQGTRVATVTTPLGDDVLLLVGFAGREGISQLFNFQLDLIAENSKDIAFDKLLGQKITIKLSLSEDKQRYFNGICNRVSQGERDTTFTGYRINIVPHFWFLTRRAQSRIFQQMSAPDILKEVLQGLDVTYEIQGTFHPRDYFVQYRETDFNFACRLMEEEGIFYFFKHTADGHKMVLANTSQSHPEVPEQSNVIYEGMLGGMREDLRIYDWEKVQELRSGKYTLWDHSFELPHKHLEAEESLPESVAVGKVNHKLRVGVSDQLEIYDYPGEYAQRFDGVSPGGGDRPGDLQKIFEDNERTVKIRMQEEAVPAILLRGNSNCRQFVSGHKFTLERHFNADGQYLLTSVEHSARLSDDYRSGGGEFHYHNSFTCIPFALPFRPPRMTPKPFVQGTQTAVVVGPPGEEIFTDKYGRVKVQFLWDRTGKWDSDSSCWIRVGTIWAGKKWGAIHIPRIGQEVIVAFQEGDPDQPIIVGSVYNAEMMPPYTLPENKTQSGIKSRSTLKGTPENFNEIRFEDKKGQEKIFIHAEKDKDVRVKHDRVVTVVNESHLITKKDRFEKDEADFHLYIKGARNEKVDGTQSLKVGQDMQEKVGMKYALDAGTEIHLKAGMNLVIESGTTLTLKVGGNFININSAGIFIKGNMVFINSGGAAGSGAGSSPEAPKPPREAEKGKGLQASSAQLPPARPPKPFSYSPAALMMKQASRDGMPFCDT